MEIATTYFAHVYFAQKYNVHVLYIIILPI